MTPARKTLVAIVTQGRAFHMTGQGWTIREPINLKNPSRTIHKTFATNAEIASELDAFEAYKIEAWVE